MCRSVHLCACRNCSGATWTPRCCTEEQIRSQMGALVGPARLGQAAWGRPLPLLLGLSLLGLAVVSLVNLGADMRGLFEAGGSTGMSMPAPAGARGHSAGAGASAASMSASPGAGARPNLRFPRILHNIYVPDRAAFLERTADPSSAMRRGWSESCRRIYTGSGWEYRFWGEVESEALLRERYPWFMPTWRNFTELVHKTDSIRPFILHAFGGLYLDNDVECWVPAEDLLAGPDVVLQGTHPWEGHTNAIMAGPPGHPLWLAIVKEIARRAREGGPLPSGILKPTALLQRSTWVYRDVLRGLVPGIAAGLPKAATKFSSGDFKRNAYVGDWLLGSSLVRVFPLGQFYSPCWFNNNTCHRAISLQRALGELPEGLVGYHRYTGTWNDIYDKRLGVYNEEQAQKIICQRPVQRAAAAARAAAGQQRQQQQRHTGAGSAGFQRTAKAGAGKPSAQQAAAVIHQPGQSDTRRANGNS